MMSVLSMGLVLLLVCGGVHYVAMTMLHARITRLSVSRAAKAQLASLGLAVAYLIEAGVHATGF